MRLTSPDGGGEDEADGDCEDDDDGGGNGDDLPLRDEEPTVDRALLEGRFIEDFSLGGIVLDI